MDHKNVTPVSEFLLRGFSSQPEVQRLLFPLFLSMYLLTLLGNMTIILLIRWDMQLLHTPMYFFLSNLAVADLGFATTVIPKALENMTSQKKTISFHGCMTQLFSYIFFTNADIYLLASMAYDRYVAICHPLYYSAMMSPKRSRQLTTVSWALPFVHTLVYTLLMSRVEFCEPGEIPHFFCDIFPILAISCSGNAPMEFLVLTEGVVEVLTPFVLVFTSYAFIFYTIMKIPSATGKRKAFSTCGSHICVVGMYFGGVIVVYLIPNPANSNCKDIVATVIYTMVNPMVNPFIYTLRNNEIKAAVRRVIKKHFH